MGHHLGRHFSLLPGTLNEGQQVLPDWTAPLDCYETPDSEVVLPCYS